MTTLRELERAKLEYLRRMAEVGGRQEQRDFLKQRQEMLQDDAEKAAKRGYVGDSEPWAATKWLGSTVANNAADVAPFAAAAFAPQYTLPASALFLAKVLSRNAPGKFYDENVLGAEIPEEQGNMAVNIGKEMLPLLALGAAGKAGGMIGKAINPAYAEAGALIGQKAGNVVLGGMGVEHMANRYGQTQEDLGNLGLPTSPTNVIPQMAAGVGVKGELEGSDMMGDLLQSHFIAKGAGSLPGATNLARSFQKNPGDIGRFFKRRPDIEAFVGAESNMTVPENLFTRMKAGEYNRKTGRLREGRQGRYEQFKDVPERGSANYVKAKQNAYGFQKDGKIFLSEGKIKEAYERQKPYVTYGKDGSPNLYFPSEFKNFEDYRKFVEGHEVGHFLRGEAEADADAYGREYLQGKGEKELLGRLGRLDEINKDFIRENSPTGRTRQLSKTQLEEMLGRKVSNKEKKKLRNQLREKYNFMAADPEAKKEFETIIKALEAAGQTGNIEKASKIYEWLEANRPTNETPIPPVGRKGGVPPLSARDTTRFAGLDQQPRRGAYDRPVPVGQMEQRRFDNDRWQAMVDQRVRESRPANYDSLPREEQILIDVANGTRAHADLTTQHRGEEYARQNRERTLDRIRENTRQREVADARNSVDDDWAFMAEKKKKENYWDKIKGTGESAKVNVTTKLEEIFKKKTNAEAKKILKRIGSEYDTETANMSSKDKLLTELFNRGGEEINKALAPQETLYIPKDTKKYNKESLNKIRESVKNGDTVHIEYTPDLDNALRSWITKPINKIFGKETPLPEGRIVLHGKEGQAVPADIVKSGLVELSRESLKDNEYETWTDSTPPKGLDFENRARITTQGYGKFSPNDPEAPFLAIQNAPYRRTTGEQKQLGKLKDMMTNSQSAKHNENMKRAKVALDNVNEVVKGIKGASYEDFGFQKEGKFIKPMVDGDVLKAAKMSKSGILTTDATTPDVIPARAAAEIAELMRAGKRKSAAKKLKEWQRYIKNDPDADGFVYSRKWDESFSANPVHETGWAQETLQRALEKTGEKGTKSIEKAAQIIGLSKESTQALKEYAMGHGYGEISPETFDLKSEQYVKAISALTKDMRILRKKGYDFMSEGKKDIEDVGVWHKLTSAVRGLETLAGKMMGSVNEMMSIEIGRKIAEAERKGWISTGKGVGQKITNALAKIKEATIESDIFRKKAINLLSEGEYMDKIKTLEESGKSIISTHGHELMTNPEYRKAKWPEMSADERFVITHTEKIMKEMAKTKAMTSAESGIEFVPRENYFKNLSREIVTKEQMNSGQYSYDTIKDIAKTLNDNMLRDIKGTKPKALSGEAGEYFQYYKTLQEIGLDTIREGNAPIPEAKINEISEIAQRMTMRKIGTEMNIGNDIMDSFGLKLSRLDNSVLKRFFPHYGEYTMQDLPSIMRRVMNEYDSRTLNQKVYDRWNALYENKDFQKILSSDEYTKMGKTLKSINDSLAFGAAEGQIGAKTKLSMTIDKLFGTKTSDFPFPNSAAGHYLAGQIYTNLLTNPHFMAINTTDAFIKTAPYFRVGEKGNGLGQYASIVLPITFRVMKDVVKGALFGGLEKNKMWNLAQQYIPHRKNMASILTTEHARGGTIEEGFGKIFGGKNVRAVRKFWQKLPEIIEAQEEANNAAIFLSFAEKELRRQVRVRGKKADGLLLDKVLNGEDIGLSKKMIDSAYGDALLLMKKAQGKTSGYGGKSEMGYKMEKAVGKNDALTPFLIMSKMFQTYPSTIMQAILSNTATGMGQAAGKGTGAKISSVLSPTGMIMAATYMSYAMPQAAFNAAKGNDKKASEIFNPMKILEVSTRDLGFRNSVMPLSFANDIKNLIVDPAKGLHGFASKTLSGYFTILRSRNMMK